jgi:glutamyl-tRNA synthetase
MPMVRTMSGLVRGRYAPSPTGDLHLGNLRTALLAWLFARISGGQFVLRIEDLDRPRVRPGSTERMLDDLRWLGLDWDEGPDIGGPYAPYTQSERQSTYNFYLQRLLDAGLVYPCYCSRAEIARVASAPHADEGPRYPGTCRNLTQEQRRHHKANNRRPSLRFRVDDDRIVSFTDMLAGPIRQHVQQAIGDFIVCRSDGIFAYQFAVVVDDALMHINQVVRGADLLNSTARQILLYEALGFPIPTFAHVPLILDEQGKRLSKRQESTGL